MRRGLPRALRTLVALPVVLLLSAALVAPATALAEETGATGYAQKPPTPTTTTPATTTPATTPAATTPAPASGTSPSKEASTPASAVSPSTSTTSSPTTKAASSKDLPFTGFDLRWTVGIGLLLMGVGFSIVTMQRRERRDAGS
jgi:uncharacterized membrane protein